jgi:hypothetical protein
MPPCSVTARFTSLLGHFCKPATLPACGGGVAGRLSQVCGVTRYAQPLRYEQIWYRQNSRNPTRGAHSELKSHFNATKLNRGAPCY